jgi:hypothetical protein
VPWVEGVLSKDGIINLVKCKAYSLIEKKEKIMGCKWDTLIKHRVIELLPEYAKFGVEKRWEIFCKRLCTFKEYEVVCAKGFQVYFGSTKQSYKEGNRNIIQMKCIFHVCLMVIPC